MADSEAQPNDRDEPRPLPTRERQKRDTRNLILKVALAEIAEFGLSGARIERIARKAGVSRPTIYVHFPTREDFLRELQARTASSALGELQKRLEKSTGAALVHALADALFDGLARGEATLRRESFALMVREPSPEEWLGNDLFSFLSERLEEAQNRREITTRIPVPELTRILMTALFGFIAIDGSDLRIRRDDAHQMLDLMIGKRPEE